MSKLLYFSLLTILITTVYGCGESDMAEQQTTPTVDQAENEEPIQHLDLPDITSRDRAIAVMDSTTAELKSKNELNDEALHDIHYITYSLEKAVGYFAENSSGEQQAEAREMAEVVEEVHINSENNRAEETEEALETYYELQEEFRENL